MRRVGSRVPRERDRRQCRFGCTTREAGDAASCPPTQQRSVDRDQSEREISPLDSRLSRCGCLECDRRATRRSVRATSLIPSSSLACSASLIIVIRRRTQGTSWFTISCGSPATTGIRRSRKRIWPRAYSISQRTHFERMASGVRRTTMACDSCSALPNMAAQLSPGIISRMTSQTSRPPSSRIATTRRASCSSECA